MKNRISDTPIFRGLVVSVLLGFVALLGGCGGSSGQGGGTSANSVNVSLAASSVAPAAPATAGMTAALSSPTPPQNIDHAWITVHRIALLPGTSLDAASGPDPGGEAIAESDGGPIGGMIASDVTPIEVDLLNLPPGQVALFLNALRNVPAGRYHKIRLYYTDPKVHIVDDADNTAMHATANFHLDIHFVGGDLVIPVGTDPAGGVKIYDVSVVFVLGKDGLKITVNPSKILMRPQVFATVDNTSLRYIVTGEADNVIDGTFDILTLGGRTIPAAFSGGGTTWAFSDNILQDSLMVFARDASFAAPAFKDRAKVSAIGVFDAGGRLQASDITFTFPDVRIGKVVSTWDNTYFRLDRPLPLDNLVYALPDKTNPLYTNFRIPPVALVLVDGYNLIVPSFDNTVKARGYAFTGDQGLGLQAFWISIDNNIGP